MLGESLRNHNDNQTPRQMNGVVNVVVTTREGKIRWEENFACLASYRVSLSDTGGKWNCYLADLQEVSLRMWRKRWTMSEDE